ncbi:MAG TPA: IGHMBP2 family helicase [Saprospiraceae bacterium]|nr:IGHMBP2 family helicase [Saprospiraceae bacterium]
MPSAHPADHFAHLLSLLHQEREEDLQEYLRQVRLRPLHERVEQGYTWYPLKVVQTGFSLGEKAFLVVERTNRLHEPHQLKAGQSVNLFTQAEHLKHPEQAGVIHYVERNRMKIILQARDVPDWLAYGQLGVDQLFDDRSYQEMVKALHQVMKAKGNRLAELRDILTGKRPPTPPYWDAGPYHPAAAAEATPAEAGSADPLAGLNDSQRAAVRAILLSSEVAVVHGPPGTGKTTTLVAAIRQLVSTEDTVLVTAPSNTAADLLTERLADAGLRVVRIGNISRVDDHVLPYTLDSLLAHHPESKNIKKVKIQAAEYRRQARQHKRSFGYEERREREHLHTQARELEAWANTLEQRLLEETLSSAQAIICTLIGATHPVLEGYRFRTCIIDEAAQALEPAAWVPISKCSRVVLAGDPFQLPPTVKSVDAARKGLSVTLIERCLGLLPQQVHLLDVQYRMHRAIMDFSNQYFYGGALRAHESVVERRLFSLSALGEEDEADTLTVFDPVVFVDTAGTGFEEKINRSLGKDSVRYPSKYNPEEALLLREHLLKLLRCFPPPAADTAGTGAAPAQPSIGILSPYREQVNYLEDLVREDTLLSALPRNLLSINTIDGFQGQERDVVYISLVRSNPKNEIGFLSDYRRMNVAMTRARKLLVVIGDSATIGNNPFYAQLLDYCEKHGAYQTAWEYML